MKRIYGIAASLATAALVSGGALAQSADLPPFLKDIDGLQYQGNVSGMDLYTMEDFTGLWLVSPDGRTAIAGSVFSSNGRDIGAAFSGAEPVTAFMLAEGDGVNADQVVEKVAAEAQILSDAELTQMEEAISEIEQDVFGQLDTAPEPVGDVVPSDAIDPTQVTQDAEAALVDFDEEEKEVLMRALVELLRDVENEDQFRQSVALWTQEIARRAEAKEQEVVVDTNIIDDVKSATNELPPVEVAPIDREQVIPASAPAEEVTGQDLAEKFLNEVRHDRMWFSVGNTAAPAVYAFIDPTCPYCARAMAVLKNEVEGGDLQLRIILTPVVSQDSPRYVAGILSADQPPKAYWDHEIEKATRGRSSLELADWDSLPQPIRQGIVGNVDMINEYGITGVPFFVFDTDEGARVVSGVPEVSDFEGVIKDPFNGNR